MHNVTVCSPQQHHAHGMPALLQVQRTFLDDLDDNCITHILRKLSPLDVFSVAGTCRVRTSAISRMPRGMSCLNILPEVQVSKCYIWRETMHVICCSAAGISSRMGAWRWWYHAAAAPAAPCIAMFTTHCRTPWTTAGPLRAFLTALLFDALLTVHGP
jgi:hypothetical protein